MREVQHKIQREGNHIYTLKLSKKVLSLFDGKRYLLPNKFLPILAGTKTFFQVEDAAGINYM